MAVRNPSGQLVENNSKINDVITINVQQVSFDYSLFPIFCSGIKKEK